MVQSVHEQLRERIAEHKESHDPEVLTLSIREVGDVLTNSGVSEEKAEAFQQECRRQYGEDVTLNPKNIIDSGIPVVNFDVDVDCQGIYKVTGDNYDMGYQSAKYITEKVGPAANIVVMDVPSSGSVCELRKQGFYDYLKEVSYDESNIFLSLIHI